MRRAGTANGWGAHGAKPAICAAAALALSACAETQRYSPFNLPPVNPFSPIAPYSEKVSQERFPTPSFAEVPPVVADVRPPAAYRSAVVDEVRQRREVAAWLAAHPQYEHDTESWAGLQIARIPAREKAPVEPQRDAEAEAFAKRLRQQAQQPAPQP